MLEAPGSDLRAHRQGRKRKDTCDDLPFEFRLGGTRHAQHRDLRVRRQRLADPDRFGDPEFVIGRLQAAIVEQRDLYRRFGGQRSSHQMPHARVDRGSIVLRLDGDDVLAQFLTRNVGRDTQAAVRRKGLTGRERQCTSKRDGALGKVLGMGRRRPEGGEHGNPSSSIDDERAQP